MMKLPLGLTFAVAGTSCLAADDFHAQMQSYLDANIVQWAATPEFIAAITAQNAETASYSQDQIDNMDQQWRGEVGTGFQPMVDAVIENEAADLLREMVSASGGAITEVFIMDAAGLNVAASVPTSDYWQGDEAKHIQTYRIGAGAVHFGDIEYDKSTEAVQGQISLTITDTASGEPIGAMTVGVDMMALM